MRAQVAGDVRDEETAAARDGGARERLDDVALPVATRRPFTRKPSLASLRTSAQKVVCFDANDGTRRRSGGGRTAARASDARGSARVRRAGEARRVEIHNNGTPIDRRFTRATCPIHEREKRVVSLAPPTTTRRDPGCARPRRRPASPSRRFSGHGNGDGASPRGPSGGAPAPGARLRHHRRAKVPNRGVKRRVGHPRVRRPATQRRRASRRRWLDQRVWRRVRCHRRRRRVFRGASRARGQARPRQGARPGATIRR